MKALMLAAPFFAAVFVLIIVWRLWVSDKKNRLYDDDEFKL